MPTDLASIVKSTSIDGQVMPGYRQRQKASSNPSNLPFSHVFNVVLL